MTVARGAHAGGLRHLVRTYEKLEQHYRATCRTSSSPRQGQALDLQRAPSVVPRTQGDVRIAVNGEEGMSAGRGGSFAPTPTTRQLLSPISISKSPPNKIIAARTCRVAAAPPSQVRLPRRRRRRRGGLKKKKKKKKKRKKQKKKKKKHKQKKKKEGRARGGWCASDSPRTSRHDRRSGILTARVGMTYTPPWSRAAWASACVAAVSAINVAYLQGASSVRDVDCRPWSARRRRSCSLDGGKGEVIHSALWLCRPPRAR